MKSACRGPVLRELDRLFRHGTFSGLGDDELLQRFLDRKDASAFEALLSLHGPMVLGICRRMLHDPRDVEDAFQATFLVLVRKAPAIRERTLLSSWLYGVAYRVANRARARAIQHHVREIAVERLEARAAEVPPERTEIGPVLDQELCRLPAKYREPLVLCYLQGRTHDQAAEQLRCPVGTVRSRMARGRELLKRRLTRRGHAPTAATLGSGTLLPAGLTIESIPASLLSATVRSALGHATLRGAAAGAIAAPILTLTHGALTTMKLGKLTWIALATLATSLSAGGVIAVALARPQTAGIATTLKPAAEKSADPAGGAQSEGPGARPQSISEAFEARLKALESKIDTLLSRSAPTPMRGDAENFHTTSSATSTALPVSSSRPAAAISNPAPSSVIPPTPIDSLRPGEVAPEVASSLVTSSSPRDASARPGGAANTSVALAGLATASVGTVRELEIQLQLALQDFNQVNNLYQRHVVSLGELQRTRGKVLLVAAALEGLDDDFSDELDRLKLEMKKKAAELHETEAQKEVAISVVARSARLNERRPGTVSEFDVAKAGAELKVADAQIEVKRVEMEELALQGGRLTRRRDRIREAMKLSARARAEIDANLPSAKAGGLAPETPRP